MRCKNCQTEVNDNSLYCPKCGQSLTPNEGKQDETKAFWKDVKIETVDESSLKSKTKIISILTICVVIAVIGIGMFFLSQNILGSQDNIAEGNENIIDDKTNIENDTGTIANDEEANSVDNNENEYIENEETHENGEYILPNSDSTYLTEADLEGLDANQCRLARNELYARHGRKFDDESLQEYFNQFEWYRPSIEADDFEESMLNSYEIANRDLIVEYETKMGYR